jgi:hypothetical protein
VHIFNLIKNMKFAGISMTGIGVAQVKPLMGELYEIYYENRDLRLLLDLLAATSGLAPPLR